MEVKKRKRKVFKEDLRERNKTERCGRKNRNRALVSVSEAR